MTAEVPDGEEASRFGVVQTSNGRVTGYAYKPEEPEGTRIATEVFAFTRPRCRLPGRRWQPT